MKAHTFEYTLHNLDDYLNKCRSEFYNTEESLHNLEKVNNNIGDILDYPDATLEEKNKIRKQGIVPESCPLKTSDVTLSLTPEK